MTVNFRVVLLFLFLIVNGETRAQAGFDKERYYEVMATNQIQVIDNEIDVLKKSALASTGAYEGALLMKKAGLVKKGKDKIDLFKAGRKKLEAAIKTDPQNAEWRFLRLMIQENAPKAVNYRNELDADCKFVADNFKALSPVVQKAINNYSKNSKVLNSKDF